MTMYIEPKHDYTSRTTATSKAEGRMKESFDTKKKKKRDIILDGMGGCKKK